LVYTGIEKIIARYKPVCCYWFLWGRRVFSFLYKFLLFGLLLTLLSELEIKIQYSIKNEKFKPQYHHKKKNSKGEVRLHYKIGEKEV
jgi:hypothetical protein